MEFILFGSLVCPVCGSTMEVIGGQYLRCGWVRCEMHQRYFMQPTVECREVTGKIEIATREQEGE